MKNKNYQRNELDLTATLDTLCIPKVTCNTIADYITAIICISYVLLIAWIIIK